MFDQTFVDGTEHTRKPVTVAASVVMQASALCILLLVPLIYTAALPNAVLKSLVVAPRPPVSPVVERMHGAQTGHMPRVVALHQFLFHAPVQQRPVKSVEQVAAPPDVGFVGATSQADGPVGSDLLGATTSVPAPPPLTEEPKQTHSNKPVRIGTGAAEAKLIHKVIPPYPVLAKETHIQGVVEFRATISKEGNIENLELVRGHPLLVKAAQEAVQQWKYRPTLLNGQPVEVLTEILVNFTLAQ